MIKYKEFIDGFNNDKIDIFELVLLFDKGESVKNKEDGVIYTPRYISDHIVESLNPSIEETILEPSVGHGVFLFSLINFIENKYKTSPDVLKEWFESKVFAFDINEKSINELKFIINLFFNKKGIYNIDLKNICFKDALFTDDSKYDVVFGNPPYIRTKNIKEDYLKKIRLTFKSCKNGNIDMYYAFIEKFMNCSKRLSFIVPNSYISNASALTLRNLMVDRLEKIINFKEKLIFQNARTYTSIFLMNEKTTNSLKYSVKLKEEGVVVDKSILSDKKWRFNNSDIKPVLNKEELSKVSITASIATLKDNLYIIKNPLELDDYYIQTYNGNSYEIEKSICIDFFKITKENETNYLIYPYINKKIMDESFIKLNFPKCYDYFKAVMSDLIKRDGGKINNYEAWYAYGRKQGLNIKINSNYLFVPIMTNKILNIDIKHIEDHFLVSSGFCIQSDSILILEKIRDSVNTDVFLRFLKENGKPWPGKIVYYTLTTKQLKEFLNNEV